MPLSLSRPSQVRHCCYQPRPIRKGSSPAPQTDPGRIERGSSEMMVLEVVRWEGGSGMEGSGWLGNYTRFVSKPTCSREMQENVTA